MFSLSTGTLYPYPLQAVFRWARVAGFHGVELVVNPEAILRGGRALRQLAEEEGVEIFSVHPTVVPLPGWRERQGGMERTIGLARDVGASVVVMHTPRSQSLDEGEGLDFLRRVKAWQPRLEGSGLRLAVENKAIRSAADRGYILTPLDSLRAFADRYDLGLVLDTTHAATAGIDLVQASQTFDGRLVDLHFSDLGGWVPLGGLRTVQKVLGQHRFPGAGHLLLKSLLAALARNGYEGPVTLEVNPFDVKAWWPPTMRRHLARAIVSMRRASGLHAGAAESAPSR